MDINEFSVGMADVGRTIGKSLGYSTVIINADDLPDTVLFTVDGEEHELCVRRLVDWLLRFRKTETTAADIDAALELCDTNVWRLRAIAQEISERSRYTVDEAWDQLVEIIAREVARMTAGVVDD